MKVLGLLSGGKDSVYSLVHCVANGHTLVALATLVPEEGIDELDSYLYQSVGTSQILPLIAESMRLPLYKRTITGKPVNVDLNYGKRRGRSSTFSRTGSSPGDPREDASDETEDLLELLLRVKAEHPDLEAISTGAILSTYQRTRIEHVCARPEVNLACLAYLWQRPEAVLVDEMLREQMKVVIVKIAGLGLKEEHVGKTLGEMRMTLGRLEEKYGCHVAGEGGEYETITLDCVLFHESIKIDEAEVVVTDPSPVAYLKIKKASLRPKEGHVIPSSEELSKRLFNPLDDLEEEVQGLSLFDETSRRLLESTAETPLRNEDDVTHLEQQVRQTLVITEPSIAAMTTFGRQGNWFCVAVEGSSQEGETVEDEVTRVFEILHRTLKENGLSLEQIQHQNFLLSSMSLFPDANKAYSRFFGSSPPSRACVAVHLPSNQRVRLESWGYDEDGLSQADMRGRTALHVQSMSYWAPANIGPYSQAVMVGHRLTIAGQIGLIPPTLLLPNPRSFKQEAVLALQHVRRILEVLQSNQTAGGGWEGWFEGVICWFAHQEDLALAKQVWEGFQEEVGLETVPCLFVQAKELPKGALVEWQMVVHNGRKSPSVREDLEMEFDQHGSGDDSDDDETVPATYEQFEVQGGEGLRWSTTVSQEAAASFTIVGSKSIEDFETATPPERIVQSPSRAFSLRVFHQLDCDEEELSRLREILQRKCPNASMSFIPAQTIAWPGKSDWQCRMAVVSLGV